MNRSEFTKNISIKKLFFKDNYVNTAIKLSWLERIVLSAMIGFYFKNVLLGVGVCFSLIILEAIPLFSVVYILVFSLFESIFIFRIIINYLPINLSSLFALFIFFLLVEIHKTLGKIDCTALGYAMILFEEILIAGLLYSLNQEIQLSTILILAAVFLLSCISFCRIIAVFLLTIASVGLLYLYGQQFLDHSNIILFSILTLCYFCTIYLWAYLGNDYIGLYRQKKFQKLLEAKKNEFPDIKSRMYEKYPALAGQYQYYQTSVCSSSEERQEFDTDWKHYLIYLDSSSRTITFNQFFEKQKLYQIRQYKKNTYRTNPYHTTKQSNRSTDKFNVHGGNMNGTSYFAGVNDMRSLKKRYRDLLKIYHPDNQNGDSSVSKQIQEEYESLSRKYQS